MKSIPNFRENIITHSWMRPYLFKKKKVEWDLCRPSGVRDLDAKGILGVIALMGYNLT